MKTMLLWGLWYQGDEAHNIKAYYSITSDELHDEKSKVQLSRAKKVIKRLKDIAVERGSSRASISYLPWNHMKAIEYS